MRKHLQTRFANVHASCGMPMYITLSFPQTVQAMPTTQGPLCMLHPEVAFVAALLCDFV